MSHSTWEDDPTEFRSPARAVLARIGRFLAWLFAIASLTLGVAYYLPLYRAHRVLTTRSVSLQNETRALERRLSDSRAELAAVGAERDRLKQRSDAADAKTTRASARMHAQLASAKTALARFLDGNVFAIDESDDRVVVSYTARGVAGIETAPLPTTAKRLAFCDVLRAVPPKSVEIVSFTDATESAPPTDSWDAAALRGRRVADALGNVCKLAPDVTSVTLRPRPAGTDATLQLSIGLPAL